MKSVRKPSVSRALRLHRKAGDESAVLTREVLTLIEDRILIVDVGAGDGAVTRLLSKGREVIAIEPSPYNAALLRKALSGDSARIMPNNIEDIKLPSHSIDAVLFTHSLYYVTDLRAVIHRALVWLKPGGIAIFVLLSMKGDQSTIISKYWNRYHKRERNMLIYPSCVRKILCEFGLAPRSKKIISYCSIKTLSEQRNFVSIALDIPFLKVLPSTRTGIRDLLSHRRPYYRPHRASTVHEVLFCLMPS